MTATVEYKPFIIAEDEALRDLLTGMTVEDDKNKARAVGVWYGQPDIEIRAQAFPYMTIDLIDVSEGTERVMNAIGQKPWYYPEPELTVDGITYDDWSVHYPVPVDLDYQITSFARQPRHDRQLLAQVLGNRLPFRFGALNCEARRTTDGGDVEIDVTTRRLDMRGVVKRDTIESGKRMFMNIFTIRVSSELPVPFLTALHKRVTSVVLTSGALAPTQSPQDGPPSFMETFTITAPVGSP